MAGLEDRTTATRSALPAIALAAAVAGLFGSEVIHMAAIGQHIRVWAVEGWFFTALAVVEGLLAAGLLIRPTPRVRWYTFVVSVVTIALWAMSRLNGLPFGPGAGQREAVQWPDLIATVLEIVTAVAVFPLAAKTTGRFRRPRAAVTAIVAAATSLTGIALLTLAQTGASATARLH